MAKQPVSPPKTNFRDVGDVLPEELDRQFPTSDSVDPIADPFAVAATPSQLDYQPKKEDLFPGAINPDASVTAQDLLESPRIAEDYVPSTAYGFYGYYASINRHRPRFSIFTIQDMVTDPRVILGLQLIKGPLISRSKLKIVCKQPDVQQYIQDNFDRFFAVGAIRVLKALEWGYSGSEVEFRYDAENQLIYFDNLTDFESTDVRPVVFKGKLTGFMLNNVGNYNSEIVDKKPEIEKITTGRYIGFPRALYHVHSRHINPFYGRSRLFGPHVPWHEQWSEDGYRNIRRLWFLRNSFDGGVLYHPTSAVATKNGPMPARDYARELLEKRRSGGVLTLPNTPGPDGTGKAWEYVPPQGNPVPAGLLEYGDLLKDEVLEALGIPPEVIQASGETGFGSSSGRQVPQEAFNATLFELLQWLVHDFDTQVLRYLVKLCFGPVQYTVSAKSLSEGVKSDPNDPNKPSNPLDPDNQGNEPPPGEDVDPNLEQGSP